MFSLIKTLCEMDGISGRENIIADFVIREMNACGAQCYTDPLGNVIAYKAGKSQGKKKVMIAAHMDEVGFIVNYITDEGMLRFTPVGGVSTKAILARSVLVGDQKIEGVIGSKAIHLTKKEERDTFPQLDTLHIDIGAKDREEAEKAVSLGDGVVFKSAFEQLGENFVLGKALDDRVGVAFMLEYAKRQLEFDTYFAFTVQEEVGGNGATVAAYTLKPDISVVLEATTAADNMELKGGERVSVCGDGPVISFMDRGTIYDRELYKLAGNTAQEIGIKWQTKTGIFGGNDSGVIHKAVGGIRPVAISIPCRNLHSASLVASRQDIIDSFELLSALVPRLQNLD